MDVSVGDSLLFIDSRDRVSIAVNQGNYSKKFNVEPPGAIFIPAKAPLSRKSESMVILRPDPVPQYTSLVSSRFTELIPPPDVSLLQNVKKCKSSTGRCGGLTDESFNSQLKQVLRRLGRAPLFTVITLITLAAGVGANTAVFSVLEGVLLKPLPYPKPDELVGVWLTAAGIKNLDDFELSPSDYFIFREQNRTLQDIGIYADDSMSVTGVAEPEQVTGLRVTDGTLPLLGILPVLGRTFTRQDDSPGAPETVVLTYGYWRRKFGADASVIGRNIIMDGKSRQIIGVLPQRFHFLDQDDPAVLIPFQFDRNKTNLGNFSYHGLARLKPGVTLKQVNSDVARMLPVVMTSFPAPAGFSMKLFEDAHIGPNVRPSSAMSSVMSGASSGS